MSGHKFIGKAIPRQEDDALVKGAGKYVDDIHLPNTLEAAFVRSSFAHAKIKSIDVSATRAAPGVHAVFTYDDIRPLLTADRLPLELRLEQLPPNVTPLPLAKDEVVFVGEAIAVVIAESRYLAEDAAALVEVDLDPLPVVADCLEATKPGAPRADTRQASNIVKDFRQTYGNTEAAFASAPHQASLRFKTHRGCAHPIEGRAVLAHYDVIEDRLTVWDLTQESHDVRGFLVHLLGLNDNQVRVIAPDVGGGFGCKHLMYPEEVVISVASRMLGRPVKWIEDRREHFLSSIQERDQYWELDVAFQDDGKLLGLRGRMIHDQGAYTPRGTNLPTNASTSLPGPYLLPNLDLQVIVAETNKVATIPVRGAGYPSANFAMERTLDHIARTLQMDRYEVRRRNLIPPEMMPYRTRLSARSGSPIIYDSGDYPKTMAAALEAIDYAGFPERQRQAREQGRFIGIGMGMGLKGTGRGPFNRRPSASIVRGRSTCSPAPWRWVKVSRRRWLKFAPSNSTCSRAISPWWRAIPAPFRWGWAPLPAARPSWAALPCTSPRWRFARSAEGGPEMLEVGVDDLELARRPRRGERRARPRASALHELGTGDGGVPDTSCLAICRPGLEHSHNFLGTSLTYSGAVACRRGRSRCCRPATSSPKIVAVNDSGVVINPNTVRGQVIGSVCTRLVTPLYEWMGYDDQAQPGDDDIRRLSDADGAGIFRTSMSPCSNTRLMNNPLGVKGAGETACIPVPGAIVSAIEDVLGSIGVRIAEFPLSPA